METTFATIIENELYLLASHEEGFLKRNKIDRLFKTAKEKGLDGQLLWYMALCKFYDKEPIGVENEVEFRCKVCDKEFKSQAALSGHGPDRCKKK